MIFSIGFLLETNVIGTVLLIHKNVVICTTTKNIPVKPTDNKVVVCTITTNFICSYTNYKKCRCLPHYQNHIQFLLSKNVWMLSVQLNCEEDLPQISRSYSYPENTQRVFWKNPYCHTKYYRKTFGLLVVSLIPA